VSSSQSAVKQPKTPSAPGRPPTGKVSRYETARRIDLQRERKLRLENDRAEGKLLDAKEVEAMVSALIIQARTRLLGLPTQAKQRLPHLTPADLLVLDSLIRDVLEELASGGSTEAA